MATKVAAPSSGFSQADFRNLAVFYDQHIHRKAPQGRPWWCYVEKPAEGAAMPMPVGPLTPMGWEAMGIRSPWEPDQKYIVKSLGRSRQGATMFEFKFVIDYTTMQMDFQRQMEDYYARAVNEAAALNRRLPEFGEPLEYQLRKIVGEAPMSPKIPEAAIAGDEWLLGFDAQENEMLARLLEQRSERLSTVKQSTARVDEMEEMRQQLANLTQLIAEQRAQPTPVKRGRPRKVQPTVTG